VLYVITGPPAAGKSTWIEAHAKQGDVVIDLDRIALALTARAAPSWNHGEVLTKVAHRARYAAIDEACQHLDDTDVYLIHSMPNPKAMAKYKRLAARIVVVDPGRSIVTERVAAMRQPALMGVVTRWYDRYRPARTAIVAARPSRQW
jgi:DNA mismatch repair ATPase MutS